MERIEDDYPPIHRVIQAVEACASENEAAYIAFMAVRLIECQRVLKDTGSIYLHCDSHANGYLRMLDVDHIWAKRDANTDVGGSDELYNLALLCRPCNGTKGNRLTLDDLRRKNGGEQRSYKGLKDMVHLGKAIQFPNERIMQRRVQTSF